MKQLLLFILLSTFAFNTHSSDNMLTASAQELLTLSQNQNPNIIILDLRTPKETKTTGVIPGAQVKNYFASDIDDFFNKLNKNKEYIIYCRSGGRSGKAVKKMRSIGLKVRNYQEGMNGWLAKSHKTVKYNGK